MNGIRCDVRIAEEGPAQASGYDRNQFKLDTGGICNFYITKNAILLRNAAEPNRLFRSAIESDFARARTDKDPQQAGTAGIRHCRKVTANFEKAGAEYGLWKRRGAS